MNSALGLCMALIMGLYIVIRPVAMQFTPYSGESAVAGLLIAMIACIAGLRAALKKSPLRVPDNMVLVLVFWLGLLIFAMLRSPHLGIGLPQACDAAVCAAMLLCGYFCMRQEPALAGIFSRSLVAMAAVEAFVGVWQGLVDLPRLRMEVESGKVALPESLQSTVGIYRLKGEDIFGTFGNPNSLAAYLLMAIFLLAGLLYSGNTTSERSPKKSSLPPLLKSIYGGMLGSLLIVALYLTNSKGAWVSLIFGTWFFAAQHIALQRPALKQTLLLLTSAGLAIVLITLALGTGGLLGANPFGRSIQVRFEYWKAALEMIRAHPLDGVGLAGFMENYPFFKTALGTEVKEVHNDYLQIWAQMGIFGLFAYLMLWWLMLRGRGAAASNLVSVEARFVSPARRANDLEFMTLIGAVVGFLILFVVFNSFSSAEAMNVFAKPDRRSVEALLHSLALPVIFVCVVKGLRSPLFQGKADEAVTGDGAGLETGWIHGVRAAAGAVLVHQIVDFDFSCQALMSGLFLLGGMLYAYHEGLPELESETRLPTANQARGTFGILSPLLLPAIALALFAGAAWIPFTSGVARENAEAAQSGAQKLSRSLIDLKKNPFDDSQYRETLFEVMQERKKAADATPFDGEAWQDLAFAYEALQGTFSTPQFDAEIRKCLAESERLRPLAWVPKASLGNYYFRSAIAGMEMQKRELWQADFDKALAAYGGAADRYPLAPGIRLWHGDVLLMTGKTEEAAREYIRALEIDMRIIDNNVRLSSVFYDPRAGAFTRHGREIDIFRALNKPLGLQSDYLTRPSESMKQMDPDLKKGLLLRRMVSAANLLREESRTTKNMSMLAQWHDDLVWNAEQFMAATGGISERAHAALFLALAHTMYGKALPQAWEQARKLQAESEVQGKPGTPHGLVEILELQTRPDLNHGAANGL